MTRIGFLSTVVHDLYFGIKLLKLAPGKEV